MSHQTVPQAEPDGRQKFRISRPKVGETPHSRIISSIDDVLPHPGSDHITQSERYDHLRLHDINFRRAPVSTFQPSVIVTHPQRHSQIHSVSQCNSILDGYSDTPELIIDENPRGSGTYDQHILGEMENNLVHHKKPSVIFNILRIISLLLIIWDSIADWWLIQRFDYYACMENPLYNYKFSKYDICGVHKETIRQVLVVFSMIGSIFGMIQIINIILTIFIDYRMVKFRLFHPLTEVYISMFVEEIPQAVTILVYMYNCDCTKTASIFSNMMIVSNFLSAIVRYTSSFPSLCDEIGCCNTWWRCCCCKDQTYLCRLSGQDCFCRCSVPCPLCCCTMECNDCNFTSHTWMGSLFRTLSCFFGCCYEREAMYGIRMMDNLGIVCLFACLTTGLILMGISGWT